MPREISAGGVVVRRKADGWELAVIEPQREQSDTQRGRGSDKKRQKSVLALPKGLVDSGEKPLETAVREVREETGISGSVVTKLTDIKYTYVRSWGDQQRVFKIVSFYLLRYQSGSIDDITPEMRIEIKRALWIPLEDAEHKLTYRGERDVIRLAREYLESHPQEASDGANRS
jgi:8-oxo-dGTP pyrophosphatase MutT (NUDIX family)